MERNEHVIRFPLSLPIIYPHRNTRIFSTTQAPLSTLVLLQLAVEAALTEFKRSRTVLITGFALVV